MTCEQCGADMIPGFSFGTAYCKAECDLKKTISTQQYKYYGLHKKDKQLNNLTALTVLHPVWETETAARNCQYIWITPEHMVVGLTQVTSYHSGPYNFAGTATGTNLKRHLLRS